MSVADPHPSLESLGWNAWFQSHRHRLSPSHVPARVVAEHRGALEILGPDGARSARLGGRLRHHATSRLDLPALGDWVGARPPEGEGEAVVDLVLPRSSRLLRQAAGRRVEAQVIAANVDLVIVVAALDQDFNARRLERWAQVVEASGAVPIVLLNKADLCRDPAPLVAAAAQAVPGAQVMVAAATRAEGLDAVRAVVRPGITACLAGSSGVGKSTVVNALLGSAVQATREVREHDHRGRHATTHRELFMLPGGGLLADTPGMRELSPWVEGEPESLASFADIEDLALLCSFRDCAHRGEPGCAIADAVQRGDISPARMAAFEKLRREQAFQARRQDEAAMRAERLRWKAITKAVRQRPNPKT